MINVVAMFWGWAVALVVQAIVAYLIYDGLIRIPRDHRTIEPYLVWLTLIPVAGLVFWWVLLPFKIPESLRGYFERNPSAERGVPPDYGKGLGLGYTISATACLIPILNFIAWIPALVFLVLYMVQYRQIVAKLPPFPHMNTGGQAAPSASPPAPQEEKEG